MAKGYWITLYHSISDPPAFAEYAKRATVVIDANGGRFLVRGAPAKTSEEGLPERSIVIEFENIEKAIAAYESPEYQAARKLLDGKTKRDVRFVQGV
jgi:uncharacterized protein (DUF1330 family)